MVGPEDFHADRPFDKNRDDYDHPWLSIEIQFIQGGSDPGKDKKSLGLEFIYELDNGHLMVNKAKRSFRATKPSFAHVSLTGIANKKECSDLTLMFRVHDSFIIYAVEDKNDECFPFTVEGKWHLEETKDELLEDMVERAVNEDIDLERMTVAEKED